MHADQRMSIFNFFVALAVLYDRGASRHVSQKFWDARPGNRSGLGPWFRLILLKNVEASLAELEKHFPTVGSANGPHVHATLFVGVGRDARLAKLPKTMVTRRTVQLRTELQSSLSVLRTRRCCRVHPVIDCVDCFRRLKGAALDTRRVIRHPNNSRHFSTAARSFPLFSRSSASSATVNHFRTMSAICPLPRARDSTITSGPRPAGSGQSSVMRSATEAKKNRISSR